VCGIENKSGSVCGCKRQDVHVPALPNEEYEDDDEDDEDYDDEEDEDAECEKKDETCANAKLEPAGSVGAVDVADSESSDSQAKAPTGPADVYVNTPEENLWANRRIGLEVIGGILLYTLGSFIGIVTVSLVKCKCD
jgi:hypothetical protein